MTVYHQNRFSSLRTWLERRLKIQVGPMLGYCKQIDLLCVCLLGVTLICFSKERHATKGTIFSGYDQVTRTSDEPHVTVRIGESHKRCNATAHIYFKRSRRPPEAPNPSYIACGYYHPDIIPPGSQEAPWIRNTDTVEQFTMLGVRMTQSQAKKLRKAQRIR